MAHRPEPFNLELLKHPATRSEAFAQLVKATSRQLYGVIRRIVQYHEDADDVLQNTYLKAWQNLDTFRGDSLLTSWLYKIAVNESLTFLSRQGEADASADIDCARDLASDPYFDGDELQLLLQQAIASLPEKQRVVFNLKYFEQMKYEDMSTLLDTSVGALKASYHLAVKKIQHFFELHG